MLSYKDLLAVVGDLYVKLQEAHNANETQTNQMIESLRGQLEEKTKLIRKLEEEYSRLETENLTLKTNDLGNKGTNNS